MLTNYYKQELRLLKSIAKDFSRDNPALTRALTGANADPDATLILEGVAFLTANIRQELDSQFPKFLHSLAQLVCPQYIRPMPSATMIAFKPKPSLAKPLVVNSGTYIDSQEGDLGSCRFKTVDKIEILPIDLIDVVEKSRDGDLSFSLQFELINTTLDQQPFDKLRLYIGGEYEEACDLYYLLVNQIKQVTMSTSGDISLPVDVIQPGGIENQTSIYPQPPGLMPAYDLLQTYFLFPEKFLFIDIDLTQWRERGAGTRFSINIAMRKANIELPKLSKEHFWLNVTPAVNLFETDSHSVLIAPTENEYQLLPNTGSNKANHEIYAVEHVESNARGVEQAREYQLFGGHQVNTNTQSVYELVYKNIHKPSVDTYIKLAFDPNTPIANNEILKAKLICSNGNQADKLHTGDIGVPTSNTPELATFKNITSPTTSRKIPLDGDMLWQLISHLSLNYLSITDSTTLKSILQQYISPDAKAKSQRLLNEKKIEAITEVKIKREERLFNNAFVHGQNIVVTVKPENFASIGDRFLFGSILDKFFASTAAINVYSEFVMEDFFSGEVIKWPAQLGKRALQ